MPDDASDLPGRNRGKVALPENVRSPWWELGRRLLAGAADPRRHRRCWCTSTATATGTATTPPATVGLIDSIYYTTVTLSTTGYGDIAPFTERARLVNAFVITPARIAFLVLLIGTTLEVLASQGREMFRVARWRKHMGQHVVIVGYGTKGRSAVETLVNNGQDREAIVVVDPSPTAMSDAHADGLAVVSGDATRREVLRRAGVGDASHVIITTNRDDSNVLSTLTVRQLNPDAWIVAAVREQENAPLMKQSGANSVITSSDAVGRLLGLSSLSPMLGSVMEDLLTYGEGLEVAERDLLVNEVGQSAAVAARPGDRGDPRREGLPLLRPGGDPAGARRPADRRPPRAGAALGPAAGHARRGLLDRRVSFTRTGEQAVARGRRRLEVSRTRDGGRSRTTGAPGVAPPEPSPSGETATRTAEFDQVFEPVP